MKNVFIIIGISLFLQNILNAQVKGIDELNAKKTLNELNEQLSLSPEEINSARVITDYVIPGSSIRMIHLLQMRSGLPVYNNVKVIAIQGGKIVSNAGRWDSFEKDSEIRPESSALKDATSAIRAALIACEIESTVHLSKLNSENEASYVVFGKSESLLENVIAELMWYRKPGEDINHLVWQIFIAPKKGTDYWLVRIDAVKLQLISKESLTTYCEWDVDGITGHCTNTQKNVSGQVSNNLPYAVNSANYNVVNYPAESPRHPGCIIGIHSNPWTLSPGNATSLGWHSDGSVYYSITKGNNVHAYEDATNSNLPGFSPASTTTEPDLNFNFSPDFTQQPNLNSPAPNRSFNISNLFYWTNLAHDLSYLYGFTETARNFQQNNQGRGGTGNDYLLAEAQDGGGVNNANFTSTPEGTKPRMQMYLWTLATPNLDGSVDNGLIVHEYTHGISNRLTGTGLGCLNNAEQMGEGWSDYFALMMTHNWTTASVNDGFNFSRAIGTYALNQPETGSGLRQFKYTTNMAVNPMTYEYLNEVGHPHGTGTIWCTVLWDMTWALIEEKGINPNLFNPTTVGGNSIALKLVLEGMRLQPCSPGFIDGRNAILKADTLFFGGQYSCLIINTFARRGMGLAASQGSSNSRVDQTISYTGCTFSPCPVPANLTTTNITFTSATISWQTVQGGLNYDVDYRQGTGGTWITLATATNITTFQLQGLTAFRTYQWRVRTNCSTGSSSYLFGTFNTPAMPNTCPSEFDISSNGTLTGASLIPLNTNIRGLINPKGDNDYYKFVVQFGGNYIITLSQLPANYKLAVLNSSGKTIAASQYNGTNNETININLVPGTYYARVYPTGNSFNAVSCYVLEVVSGANFITENLPVIAEPTVYPVPTNNKLLLEIPGLNEVAVIRIFDVTGKLVKTQNIRQSITELDINDFSAGVHILQINRRSGITQLKFTKL